MEYKELVFDLTNVNEKGVISGYGAVFDNCDHADDIIHKGAFLESLNESKTFPMLWQHDTKSPVGIWDECYEDDYGLFMKGRLLIDDVQKAKEAYALAKSGVINGLSIGYSVKSSTWEETEDKFIRHINAIKLWETSIVTFPCNELARVTDVKQLKELEDMTLAKRTAEKALCNVGFSHNQAKIILSKGFNALTVNERDVQNNVRDEQNDVKDMEFINNFFKQLKGK